MFVGWGGTKKGGKRKRKPSMSTRDVRGAGAGMPLRVPVTPIPTNFSLWNGAGIHCGDYGRIMLPVEKYYLIF